MNAADRFAAPTLKRREADRRRREEMVATLERAIEAGKVSAIYRPQRPDAVWAARAGHGSKIALVNFVGDDDPPLTRVFAEHCHELEQRTRKTGLRAHEARGGKRLVRLPE